MKFRVLIDTNVLAPAGVHDILLTLGSGGLFQPLWSEDILEELSRTLDEDFGLTEDQINHRLEIMGRVFPEASVTGYKTLIPTIDCTQVDDRHVLAAAIAGGAGAIVTDNLKDFPMNLFELHGIEILHPDEFLEGQFGLNLPLCVQRIARILRRWNNPKLTVPEMAIYYEESLPQFGKALIDNQAAIEFYQSLDN